MATTDNGWADGSNSSRTADAGSFFSSPPRGSGPRVCTRTSNLLAHNGSKLRRVDETSHAVTLIVNCDVPNKILATWASRSPSYRFAHIVNKLPAHPPLTMIPMSYDPVSSYVLCRAVGIGLEQKISGH